MVPLETSFVRAGTGGRRNRIAALCVFAGVLAAISAGAQRGRGMDRDDSVGAQLIAARNQQLAGRYQSARSILLKALSTAPNSTLLLNQFGSVEQDLGEYAGAERFYLHALSSCAETGSDPERLVILNNLGTLYFETAQYAKGDRIREQLEKLAPGALERRPAVAGALLHVLGSLEHARNRDDHAESYFARSLQLFQAANGPVSVDGALVKNSLGGLRLEAGRYDSAGDFFRQAIREIEIASGS